MKKTNELNLARSATTLLIAGIIFANSEVSNAQIKRTSNDGKTVTAQTVARHRVAADTVIRARLTTALDSSKAQIDDAVSAIVIDPVYSADGKTLIPAGSTISGRVTDTQPAQKDGRHGSLEAIFTSLALPNKRTATINASLAEGEDGTAQVDTEGRVSGKSAKRRDLLWLGGDTGGGAIIGALADGGVGAVVGGLIGAGGGAAARLLNKGHEAKVAAGTEFNVILNQSLTLPAYK